MHHASFFRHACARRAHPPSFEHLGSPFGRHGGRGFMGGRKLGAEDLQLVILALLAEQPRHGYEIIKQLEEVSRGFYAPSPGMVYPALTYLEEIGHASVESEGTRKLYRITEAGKAHLDANRETVATMLAQLKWVGEKMEHVRRAFAAEGDAHDGTTSELREARAEVRAAIVAKRGASDDEQRRVAEILKRAAREIRRK